MRELSVEEMQQLVGAGVTSEELAKQWDMFPDQNFDTALGSVVMLKNGQGQERNQPFQTQEEADAQVSGEESSEVVAE